MFFSPAATASLAGLKEVPPRLVIARWGRNESANGDFHVTPTTARVLPALQKLLGFEDIVLDFEHNTVPGTAAYEADREPRNIAAQNAKVRVIEGEGIVIEGLKWTPSGEKSIREGLHPDLSPTVRTNDQGEVVFVHSAGLCRHGAVHGLQVHSATDLFDAEKLRLFSAALGDPQSARSGPAIRPPHSAFRNPSSQPTTTTMDYKKLLLLLLGLAPTASDADIEAACQAWNEKAAGLETHGVTLKALQDSLHALAARVEHGDRAQLVREAIAAGKLVPHGAEIDRLPLEAFRAVLETLPAGVVPLAQRTPEGLRTHAAAFNTTGSPAADTEIARQMGNDPEKLKKYGDKLR